jgi:hypothetical protein
MRSEPGDQSRLDAGPHALDPDADVPCPRCGYSQRGVIESWRDACPLDGRCAECGLTFTWSELLRPRLHARWCVEYAPRRRRWLPPSIRQTIVRSSWPWWFWRSLKMSHAIRPRRLAAYALILVAWLVMIAAIAQVSAAIAVRHTVAKGLAQFDANTLPRLPARIQDLRQKQQQLPQLPPAEREQESAHLQQWIDGYTAALNAPPSTVNHSYPAAVAEAFLTPWSSRSRGWSTVALGGTEPYPAPRELYWYLLTAGPGRAGLRSVPLFRLAVVGTTASLGLFVLMPFGFGLLPVSRRKAKVRWRHIVRVMAYGLLIPVVLVSAGIVVTGAALLTAFDSSGSRPIAVALAVLACAPVPLVALWWTAAIRNYLRMPHAWALTGMLTVMNLLLLTGLLWLVNPDLAGDLCAMVS